MDSMQLLRSYREDQPELNQDDFDQLRGQLQSHLEAVPAPARPTRNVRHRLAFAAVGTAAAACLTVGVVTAGPAPQASADAARLLQSAAYTAQAETGGGASKTLVIHEEALAIDGDTKVPLSAAYLDRTVTTLQIPAGAGEWTRSRYALPTVTFFGGAAARAFEKRDTAGAPMKQDPVVERSNDGSFTVGELGGRDEDLFGSDVQQFRELPTDSAALLTQLREADLGMGAPRDEAEHVLTAASLVLDSGVADGNLQAAVFTALQQQEGLEVTAKSVNLDGRLGTAISVATNAEATEAFQLILEPGSGQYLGHRQVTLTRMGAIPAGTTLDSTAIMEQ